MSSMGHPSAPGMMRHGPPPGVAGSSSYHILDPQVSPELAERKMIAEIDQLVEENCRLAASQVPLRRDIVSVQEEGQRVKTHIKSIQRESDIQIRVLAEKIGKMESDGTAGVCVNNELLQAHVEAQNLTAARKDLTVQIKQATQELEKARADIKKLPDMLSELDSMALEHQKLRSAFEYQKRFNIEQVEQLRAAELELLGMVREVERLRAEIVNGEKRIQDPSYAASAIRTNGPCYDSFVRAHMGGADGMISYGSFPMAVGRGTPDGALVADGSAPHAIVGDYDPSVARS